MGKTREQAKVQACKLQVFAGKRRKYVQMSRLERERVLTWIFRVRSFFENVLSFVLRLRLHDRKETS
jgi:hypothetical protein